MTASGARLPGLPTRASEPEDLPPQALRLAVALSTSVRIEPELLRIVRLRTEPTLDVAAESDVWYGPWALRNGGAYMALQPTLLAPLRERLSVKLSWGGPEDPLRQIGGLVAAAHRGLSPVLALEESVTWAAVLADAGLGDLVAHTVDELMEPALRAAVESPARHEGLRRWFTGASQRLPERVLSSRSTTHLARVLDVGASPGEGTGAGRGSGDRARRPAPEAFVLAVRHDGSHITVGDAVWPATAIRVPDGPTLVLDVSEDPTRWERVARVTLRRGAAVSVPVQHVPVYVRTEAGVIYALGAPHASAGWESGLPQADAAAGLARARVSQLTDFHAVPYGIRSPVAVGIPAAHSAVTLSPLPPYLPRQADEQLASAMAEATAAESRGGRFVLLTGAPMSGRTRTLWEGMRRRLSSRWVLCPPRGISAPDLAAMLRTDPLASPAVLWLDALDTRLAGEFGEDLAQSVTELLEDPATGDVLVLATAGTNPYALGPRARSLFARATTVPLPAAFTKRELAALEEGRLRADPRLSEAVRRHRHGRIAQFLSGLDRSSAEGPGLQRLRTSRRVAPVVDVLPPGGLFTGRQVEAAALLERLDPAASRRQDPVVAVTGLPGVGKTRLAVEVAREARARGLYPGGILFADLNGYTPGQLPSPAERVLNLLLRSLGVEPAEIPAEPAERTDLYRALLAEMAEAGLPVLIVLDNAASEDQLRPLLPRVPGVGVLVTTRSRTTAASGPAYVFELTLPAPQDAVAMLEAALQASGPDTRVRDHPAAALDLAGLCGFLPLALALVAAWLKASPTVPIVHVVAELAGSRDRLDVLGGFDDGEHSVRAALELSYVRLTEPAARALRYLAIAPGADISTRAAAQLFDVRTSEARRLLAHLADAQLLGTAAWGHWRMHDLIRLYAREQASAVSQPEERGAAIDRLAAFYLSRARSANAALSKGTPDFPERANAVAWLVEERLNLLAMVESGPPRTAVDLALAMVDFLTEERFFEDLLGISARMVEAASARSDQALLAAALNNTGVALTYLRRFEEAVPAFERARDIHRALGDAQADARALNNLGAALLESGRPDEATAVLTAAMERYTELGYGPERGEVINNLGTALLQAGRAGDALAFFEQALSLVQEAARPREAARQLGNLAGALRSVGRHAEAIAALERAADLYLRAGALHGQAQVRNNLGNVLRQVHRTAEAIDCLTEAVTLFADLGDRHGEAQALNNLGAACLEADRVPEALDALLHSSRTHADLGDRYGEAQALNNLGLALFEAGRFEEALEHLLWSRDIYQELGDRSSEAQALNNAGNALRRLGRHTEAADQLSAAIALFGETDDITGLLRTRDNLGLAQWEGGQAGLAAATFRANLAEYAAVGDQRGQAQGFNNLGSALLEERDYQGAVAALSTAAELLEEVGDRGAWAQTVGNLGLALELAGRVEEALHQLRASVEAHSELVYDGYRWHALYNLGSALRRAGRREESEHALREAARLARLARPALPSY